MKGLTDSGRTCRLLFHHSVLSGNVGYSETGARATNRPLFIRQRSLRRESHLVMSFGIPVTNAEHAPALSPRTLLKRPSSLFYSRPEMVALYEQDEYADRCLASAESKCQSSGNSSRRLKRRRILPSIPTGSFRKGDRHPPPFRIACDSTRPVGSVQAFKAGK